MNQGKGILAFSNGKQLLDSLALVYYALVLVPIVAFGYLYLELFHGQLQALLPADQHALVHTVLGPVCAVLVAVAFGLGHAQRKTFATAKLLRAPLRAYAQLQLRQYVLLAVASVVADVGLALTASQLWVAIFVIVSLILIPIQRPTAVKLARDFRLTRQQADRLMVEDVED